jgi:hypothetical protein
MWQTARVSKWVQYVKFWVIMMILCSICADQFGWILFRLFVAPRKIHRSTIEDHLMPGHGHQPRCSQNDIEDTHGNQHIASEAVASMVFFFNWPLAFLELKSQHLRVDRTHMIVERTATRVYPTKRQWYQGHLFTTCKAQKMAMWCNVTTWSFDVRQ